MLLNIAQDHEDEFFRYKLLLSFINPKAAEAAFDKTIEETTVDDEAFLQEVNAHTANPVTSLDELEQAPQKAFDSKLDRIERVD